MTRSNRAETVLAAITHTLIERFQPRRVVLFGSRARGDARPDSDYDVMVEVDAIDATVTELAAFPSVRGADRPVDVIVNTPEQLEADGDDVGLLTYNIMREGLVLYERQNLGATWPLRVSEGAPGPPRSAKLWIERADLDYRMITLALSASDPPWDPICYHAQQAVEKLLKAALVYHRIQPPRSHLLTSLYARLPAPLRDDETLARSCTLLNWLLGYVRYPAWRMPTTAEGRAAADAARYARDIILPVIAKAL